MRSVPRRGLAAALSITLLSALALVAGPHAVAAGESEKTDRVYVLNNNVENRAFKFSKCDYDFDALLHTVRDEHANYPDVLTFQQISHEGPDKASDPKQKDRASLKRMTNLLKAEWGVEYTGVVAVKRADNKDMYPNSDECGMYKGYQTNAVLWRVDRFKLVGQRTWDSYVEFHENPGVCAELGKKVKKQLRTRNIAVALTDSRDTEKTDDDENLVVASVHWAREPKIKADGTKDKYYDTFTALPCAKKNMQEADSQLSKLVSGHNLGAETLRIVGGDMNAQTSDGNWWQWATKAGVDYIDPIADKCGQVTKGQTAKCLPTHATTQSRNKRIDYILIKNGTATSAGARTIQHPAKKPYSGHNAIRTTALYKKG